MDFRLFYVVIVYICGLYDDYIYIVYSCGLYDDVGWL